MAVLTWQIVARTDCRATEPAELLEERVYPADMLDSAAAPFQIRARKCASEEACRAAGMPCRWTGFNPGYDPFAA